MTHYGRGGMPLPDDPRDVHGIIAIACAVVIALGIGTLIFVAGYLTGRWVS